MPSFVTRERLRTVALGFAVLLSLPNALRPPAPDNHPGFTAAFAWIAIALMPWTAILPFAVMRATWPALAASVALLGAAVLWRSAPLAALGCAVAVAPMLEALPTSTSLALGIFVIGAAISHERMPLLVTAALACAALVPFRHRGAIVAALAIIVRVVHR